MSHVIRISDKVHERLATHALGFETPTRVIEKLLDQVEGVETKPESTAITRDFTKYLFQGSEYGKGRLVFAVIKAYVNDQPNTSYDQLMSAFPKRLQGSLGVFDTFEHAQETFERERRKRHFIGSGEEVELSDAVIAVSSQWGSSNIDRFIDVARALGFDISEVPSKS